MKFNSKTPEELGVYFLKKTVLSPSKKKIKENIAFMDSVYDFSSVATMGEPIYTQRIIKCTFAIVGRSKEELHSFYTLALDWLMTPGQQKLEFDDMPGYYYLGEVEETSSFDEVVIIGEMEVTFICEPFKYSVDLVGHEAWDNFNFLLDYMQDTSYTINGNQTISIINQGKNLVPYIVCSSAMTLTLRGYSYNLTAGEQRNFGIILLHGDNSLAITGNGTIEFKFRRELL